MMHEAFFTYIVKASALLFLFWALYKAVLTRETFFNHNRRFLILGALVAVLLPLWVIERIEVIQVALTPVSTATIPSPPPLDIPDTGVNIESLLFYVYLAGVIVFTLKLLMQFASLFRLIHKAQYRKKHKGLHLIFSSEVTAPFSFFHYIVLPEALKEEEDTSVILAHEGVHVKQGHSLDIVFMHLLTIFMWINPIAWLYRKDVAQNLEYLADRAVSSTTIPTKKYQYVLLKQHLSPQQLSIINPFINSLIKKRIVMLHQQPSNPTKLWKFGIAVPALIAFVLLFNIKTVAQYQFQSPDPALSAPNNPNPLAQEHLDFMIHKDMNEAQLHALRAEVDRKGGKLKWKKIKRNDAGQITAITLEFSHKNSTASANFSNDKGIENINFGTRSGQGVYMEAGANLHGEHEVIWIGKDSDKKFSAERVFYTADSMQLNAKDHKIKLFINGDDTEQSVWISKDGEKVEVKGDKKMAWTSKGNASANVWISSSDSTKGKKVFILEKMHEGDTTDMREMTREVMVELKDTGDSGEHIFHIKKDTAKHEKIIIKEIGASQEAHEQRIHVISTDDAKPLMIINGKETKGDVMQTMNPDKIDNIKVLKGEPALKAYGKKGKDGVILITTKDGKKELHEIQLSSLPPAPPAISEIDFNSTAVFINGKKATEKELKALSPDDIDNMEVIKGKKAEEKYGKPAAILITTKK